MKELLKQIGLEPERIEMFNMSAAMAGEFVARATEFHGRITALGASPLRAPRLRAPRRVDRQTAEAGGGQDDDDKGA